MNKIIDSLPFELNLPGYQYCGSGIKLKKKFELDDKGINVLNSACKLHDIEFSKAKDINERNKADRQLAERAWNRVKAEDSTWSKK